MEVDVVHERVPGRVLKRKFDKVTLVTNDEGPGIEPLKVRA
jgi:hypothetical protein